MTTPAMTVIMGLLFKFSLVSLFLSFYNDGINYPYLEGFIDIMDEIEI